MTTQHNHLSPQRERWLLLTLAGVQFTHILDFMIMMPLGPQLTALFGISDARFGLLVSAYTLAAGASGLIASLYIDRIGRKRLLLTLYILFGLATLACGLAPDYAALMGARIAAGTFGGVLSALSHTIVADAVPFERRGRAMGVVMTAFSVSTVAGVPLSLFLAAHLSWHAPFIAIALLCAVLALLVAYTMPSLRGHLHAGAKPSPVRGIVQVLAERNHQKALLFSALVLCSGFAVIPYITIYMRSNVGLSAEQIPYIYLIGGVCTLVSARWVGRWADRRGKVWTFKRLALLTTVPLVTITLLGQWPLWVVLIATSTFFVCSSARMIPGMAIISASAQPQLRGTFMSLNGAVQSAAMGLAAFVGGSLISRDAQGHVQGYWMAAMVGLLATVVAVNLVGRLRLYGTDVVKGTEKSA